MHEKGDLEFQHTAARRRLGGIKGCVGDGCGFNTQPPEGGWFLEFSSRPNEAGFNTQPPEGGWERLLAEPMAVVCVSTHSRPKAAGCRLGLFEVLPSCFNTQPPEGGWQTGGSCVPASEPFQHTAARRRLGLKTVKPTEIGLFQHTAARRRLGLSSSINSTLGEVSTHSRPKAAGFVVLSLPVFL